MIDKISKIYTNICFMIITFGTILIMALLLDRVIEAIIMVLTFHFFRGESDETFHAKTMFRCWVISNLTFLLLSRVTASIEETILAHILLAFILNMIMYHVWNYYRYLNPPVKFKTEEDVRIFCQVNNLDDIYIRRLIYRFIDKKTVKQIAELEFIEKRSMEEWFRLYRRKIESFK